MKGVCVETVGKNTSSGLRAGRFTSSWSTFASVAWSGLSHQPNDGPWDCRGEARPRTDEPFVERRPLVRDGPIRFDEKEKDVGAAQPRERGVERWSLRQIRRSRDRLRDELCLSCVDGADRPRKHLTFVP